VEDGAGIFFGKPENSAAAADFDIVGMAAQT
jgi:hypothetical protein